MSIPFDDLPKRAIRDWVEDWMDVSQPNAIGGLGGGDASNTILYQSPRRSVVPGSWVDPSAYCQYVPDWGPLGTNTPYMANIGGGGSTGFSWVKFQCHRSGSYHWNDWWWPSGSSSANNYVKMAVYGRRGGQVGKGILDLRGVSSPSGTEWIPKRWGGAILEAGATHTLVFMYPAGLPNGTYHSTLSDPMNNLSLERAQGTGGCASGSGGGTPCHDVYLRGLCGTFTLWTAGGHADPKSAVYDPPDPDGAGPAPDPDPFLLCRNWPQLHDDGILPNGIDAEALSRTCVDPDGNPDGLEMVSGNMLNDAPFGYFSSKF